jgi:hypothetical protein
LFSICFLFLFCPDSLLFGSCWMMQSNRNRYEKMLEDLRVTKDKEIEKQKQIAATLFQPVSSLSSLFNFLFFISHLLQLFLFLFNESSITVELLSVDICECRVWRVWWVTKTVQKRLELSLVMPLS